MIERSLHLGWLVAGCALFVALAGCANRESSNSTSNGGKPYRIAVIPKGTTHVFWKSVHAGALKAARELQDVGIPVEIQWKGALLENDREGQINVVQDFVA